MHWRPESVVITSSSTATSGDEVGAVVVSLDPLARDYLANLHAIAAALADALNGRHG